MHVVQCVYVPAGPTSLTMASPAAVLADESPMLVQTFKKALLERPAGFRYGVELEGFPVVQVEWVGVAQTAGALIVQPFVARPNRVSPDVLCLLLNGLETPADLATLAKRFPIRADHWQQLVGARKPVAFCLLFTVGRLREPCTVTVINAMANAFFMQFGTNEAPDPRGQF